MDEFRTWHNETIGAKLVSALEKNNFQATYAKTKGEVVEKILAEIPQGAQVGIAGSWTITELDLDAKLRARGTTVYNHNLPGVSLSPEEGTQIRHKELNADVLLCSTNAVTLGGELINVDGIGNRVASMIYGPKKSYYGHRR
jgi:hypothetical protein